MAVSSTYAEWLWWAPVAVTDPSAQEGYQALVTVAYVAGKMRTDFGDLRFTDESDTALSHALVSKTDEDEAVFRVKLPANCTGYRVFAGKSDATSAASPADTYDLYEDFSSGVFDGTVWQNVGAGGNNITDGIATIRTSTTAAYLSSDAAFASGYAVEARVKFGGGACWYGFEYDEGSASSVHLDEFDPTYVRYGNGTTFGSAAHSLNLLSAYHVLAIARHTGHTVYSADGTVVRDESTIVSADARHVVFHGYTAPVYIDWVLVRKCAATEPSSTIGIWGTAQSVPADLDLSYHVLEPVPADLALSYHVLAPVPAGLVACYDLEILPPELAMPYDIRKAADLATPYDIRLAADVETPSAQRTASDLVI